MAATLSAAAVSRRVGRRPLPRPGIQPDRLQDSGTDRFRPIGFGCYRAAVLTDPDYWTGRDDR